MMQFIGLALGIVVVIGALTACTGVFTAVPEPPYKILAQQDAIEEREYAPMIVAEVTTNGARDDAAKAGFRLLADYIFGNNTTQQKLAMTAPVQQQTSEKLAMTTPVQQQAVSSEGAWKVRFVMPTGYTLATLPKPNNTAVQLIEQPVQRYVVIRFSGTSSAANLGEHQALLEKYITAKQRKVTGAPQYAFYNPPRTLPFMRRNEIMFALIVPPAGRQ